MASINCLLIVWFTLTLCYYVDFGLSSFSKETYSQFISAELPDMLGNIRQRRKNRTLKGYIQYGPSFVIPTPRGEVLKPRGFRVSIPDEEGIEYFYFNGKINKMFFLDNDPYLVPEIIGIICNKTSDGRWTYENRTTDLKRGDSVFYWIAVSMFNGSYSFSYNHNLTKHTD